MFVFMSSTLQHQHLNYDQTTVCLFVFRNQYTPAMKNGDFRSKRRRYALNILPIKQSKKNKAKQIKDEKKKERKKNVTKIMFPFIMSLQLRNYVLANIDEGITFIFFFL